MKKSFQRTVEDFTCEKCGMGVRGSGYTNHCQECLWSKHVDVNPGDRAASCGELMEPVGLGRKKGRYFVLHRCEKCGFERKNLFSEKDSFEALLRLSEPQSQL